MKKEKTRVAILTTFLSNDPAYSLCNVVADQLAMFTAAGYKVKLIVTDQFPEHPGAPWEHELIEYARIPVVQLDNDGNLNDKYKDEISLMRKSLEKHLENIDVVLAHDITLQPAHLIHNMACRQIAEKREDLRWLHWVHSASAPRVMCNRDDVSNYIRAAFPNSFYVYPNDWTRPIVARNFNTEQDLVKVVHHPTDIPEFFTFHEYSRQITKEMNLLEADSICVYPCRLDRGKQPEYNIKIMAAMKKMGWRVKLIIFDFHSTGGDKVTYRNELKQTAEKWGLIDKVDILWISEWSEKTKYQAPRQVVKDLKLLSDLCVHPSTSETYSLVVQESMLCRNFCVLNHHFPAMRDIYGSKNVLYEPFGGAVNILDMDNGSTTLNIGDEKLHFDNLAKKVIYFLENDWAVAQFRFIRKHRNTDYVFKMELEPLLYAVPLMKYKK